MEKTVVERKTVEGGIVIALIKRASKFQPWVVAWCYDESDGTWGQGHYFSNLSDAVAWFEKY